jgi:hypothetical protein
MKVTEVEGEGKWKGRRLDGTVVPFQWNRGAQKVSSGTVVSDSLFMPSWVGRGNDETGEMVGLQRRCSRAKGTREVAGDT